MEQIISRGISIDDFSDQTIFSPILVGVSGGSASGKTTLCNHISSNLKECVIFSLDNYYKGLDNPDLAKDHNFDDPSSLDFDLMFQHIQQLMNRRPVETPNYCFKTHKRLNTTTTICPSDIIFFEGIFGLFDQRIRDLMTFKIFVHCDDDIRLSRRILRDVTERGRDPSGVLQQYNRFVKPSYNEFIKPTIDYADIIVPGGRENNVSIQFIVQNLKNILKGINKIKDYIKSTLFFHGDLMESFWLVPQNQSQYIETPNMINIYLKKKLIFEKDVFTKKQIRHYMNQFQETYNHNFIKKGIKYYFKLALNMFKQSLIQNGIDLKDVDFTGDNQNQCRLFIVPWIFYSQQQNQYELIKKKINNQQNSSIYILNIFATVNQILKYLQLGSNLYAINILCISNEEKFIDTIEKNCQDYKENLQSSFKDQYIKQLNKFFIKNGLPEQNFTIY